MGRNRASARQAGSRMERVVADYLAEHVSPAIDRRVLTGNKDKGDLANVRCYQASDVGLVSRTGRVVVEVKDCATLSPAQWVKEAEVERINDDAEVGLVVFKRRGNGDPGQQYVLMTLENLATLLAGERPN